MMDELLARTFVETLAKGIDPTTGLALPDAHLCCKEEMQEALETVLKYCTIESTKDRLEREREERAEARRIVREKNLAQYTRTGTPWTRDEEQRLIEMNKYKNIWYSAAVLRSSPSAITSKLKDLGRKPNKVRQKK